MSEKVRHYLAAGFAAAAIVAATLPESTPTPTPDKPTALVLAGKFVGPHAAEDAVAIAALTDELARIIAEDGSRSEPRLKTGIQFDELRVIARENRTKGVSIGERQPKVRDEIHRYLEEVLGVSGGPVSAEQRGKWVDALFEVSREASRAAGK